MTDKIEGLEKQVLQYRDVVQKLTVSNSSANKNKRKTLKSGTKNSFSSDASSSVSNASSSPALMPTQQQLVPVDPSSVSSGYSSSPMDSSSQSGPAPFAGLPPGATNPSAALSGLQQVILVNEHGMPIGQTFLQPGQTLMPPGMQPQHLSSQTIMPNPMFPSQQPPTLLSQQTPSLMLPSSQTQTPEPAGPAMLPPSSSSTTLTTPSTTSIVTPSPTTTSAVSKTLPSVGGGKTSVGKKKGKKSLAKEHLNSVNAATSQTASGAPTSSSTAPSGLKAPPGATIVLNESMANHDSPVNDQTEVMQQQPFPVQTSNPTVGSR